ncbi:MAG TPA: glycosyltransferase family 39 protein [Myxococcota bacterium]|nr:glycosyltransferase family 39 protein [Myxococcota bacterium]
MTRVVLLLFALCLAANCVAAARLDLMPDEAFFWMCSQRLALSYVDHPPMTALLARGGAELFGTSPFGARALFVLAGALLPLCVYALARPVATQRDAVLAAGFTLIVPGLPRVVVLGDVPLLVFAALALASFERATRTRQLAAWLACGAATGLAFATHYRALSIPLAFGLYLGLTRGGRAHWRAPGLWLAIALALVGLLPSLVWNAQHGFASIRYQMWERHAGAFSAEALVDHLRMQLLGVTPTLYIALLAVLAVLVRRAWRGDDRAALYACFSLAYLGTFLLASPWADREHVSLHWPMAGYLPLLAFLPAALRAFAHGNAPRVRRVAIALVPGVALTATAFFHLETATGVLGTRELQRAFGGWSTGVAAVRDALPGLPPQADGTRLVVSDAYALAGNLEMRLGDAIRVYVLDHPKQVAHGRALQFRLWGLDEAGLARHAGATALIALDRDQSRSAAWDAWRAHAAARFDAWTPLAEVVAEGRRELGPRFFLYRGQVLPDLRAR